MQKVDKKAKGSTASGRLPLEPGDAAWTGLPRDLAFVKDETWRLQIAPRAVSTYTREYVLGISPERLLGLRQLYLRLESAGRVRRLYAWASRAGVQQRMGEETVMTLLSILDTLDQLGKLKVRWHPKVKADPSQRFPNYLVCASLEFRAFTYQKRGASELTAQQKKQLRWLIPRFQKDAARVEAYVANKSVDVEKRAAVLRFGEFLADEGLLPQQED